MVKKKADPLQQLNSLNSNIARMNEAFQKATEPMKNIQSNMLSSALREQMQFQHSTAEHFKGLNAFAQIQSAAVAAAYPSNSLTQIEQFINQMADQFKEIKVPTSAGLVQLAETLQCFNEINTKNLTTALDQVKQNWNQSWVDSWSQNFEALSSAALNCYIYDNENNKDEFDVETNMVSEDYEEFKKTLNDLSAVNEQNWQQKFMTAHDKWKEKNPVYSNLIKVLFRIFIFIISLYFQTVVAPINIATIRSEPSTQSETVAIFDQNQRLTVIGDDVPYYYQIEFCDPTTGNVKTGWVSKKSVMIIEEDTIEETMTEE